MPVEEERPRLRWAERGRHALTQAARLRERPELGEGDRLAPCRLLHGDNLPILEALLPELSGAIQCVYIDPPYNTGEAAEHYEDGLPSGSWLELMRARLERIRRLLRPEGSLFIHLDDNEIDYVKVLLDELFGRASFVARITLDVRAPSAFSTVNRGVFKASEYLLWYAKDRSRMKVHPLRVSRSFDRSYARFLDNPEDPPARWRVRSLREALIEHLGEPNPSPARLERFVVTHAHRICRLAPISDRKAGKATVEAKRRSLERPTQVLVVERPRHGPNYVLDGNQLVFYDRNVQLVEGELRPSRPLSNIWTDLAWEGIAAEGGVRFKKGKKPERLLHRCLALCTDPGDHVLDCFAGSGTTGAVAQKMGRAWILIEQGDHCRDLLRDRLARVVRGEDEKGVSAITGWKGGGGFRFFETQPS
ncbi:MAG: site-specific DNA-methyltransferase [Myxococcales bacterium]|nr:site-specific DNA-methyltransferase [Myxococcales bacterium]